MTHYYTKDRGKVTLKLTGNGTETIKERYINRGEPFTPSQSDFPAKEGYRLVLPNRVTFNGVNDMELEYSYEVGNPEPTPVVPTPPEPTVPEIPKENIVAEEIYKGEAIDLTDNIRELPIGTSVTVLEEVGSEITGNFIGKVRVTFVNNTTRDVNIPVIVKEPIPTYPNPVNSDPVDSFNPAVPEEDVSLPLADVDAVAGD